jgi:preprotein translocase subunit SecA
MEVEWKENIVSFIKNITTDILVAEERRMEEAKLAMQRAVLESSSSLGGSVVPHYENEKVGRNDMCSCGSGKKYKHCHGK